MHIEREGARLPKERTKLDRKGEPVMKKFLTLALAAVMTLTLLAGCGDSGTPAGSGSNAPAGGNLIFTTGGETGTYYAFGGVIAQDVTANTPTTVTAISSDGSKANVLLLKSGDEQLGFCQSWLTPITAPAPSPTPALTPSSPPWRTSTWSRCRS